MKHKGQEKTFPSAKIMVVKEEFRARDADDYFSLGLVSKFQIIPCLPAIIFHRRGKP